MDPFPQTANIWAKKMTLFLKNQGHTTFLKNRPFLSEIQNDDAYPLTGRVAGPGIQPNGCPVCGKLHIKDPLPLLGKSRVVILVVGFSYHLIDVVTLCIEGDSDGTFGENRPDSKKKHYVYLQAVRKEF